jgi:hypothetical protein
LKRMPVVRKAGIVFTLAVLLLLPTSVFSQPPEGFSYQAILRDASGMVRADADVSIEITIVQDSAAGSIVFDETHTVTTNSMGLITLQIGSVNTSDFLDIDWSDGPYFMRIKVDGTEMGASQLLSVPYALHAKTVETDHVDDADADPSNEIQILSLNGSELSLSNGGGTVTLPASGTGDNWGTQTVATDASLTGNGTSTSPLKIAQRAATTGQVLKWNGSSWLPATDETGDESSNPTGPAGGDLTGNYPDPVIGDGKINSVKILDGTIVSADIANNAVNSAKIQDGSIVTADLANNAVSVDKLGSLAVSTAKIQDNAVTTAKIGNGAVTGAKIAQGGAVSGQVIKWNGTEWLPANDNTGNGELNLPYAGNCSSIDMALNITNSSGGGIKGKASSGSASYSVGISGVSEATEGRGVYASGYKGIEAHGEKYGVFGRVTGDLGYGVQGLAESSSSYGVFGFAPIFGVKGQSTGIVGQAVTGEATGASSIGVYGEALESGSTGVFGIGSGYGVEGNGTIGVIGRAGSSHGIGIRGLVSYTSGLNYGIYGSTHSSEGYGIYGIAPVYGVYGYSENNQGRAVMGEAENENSIGVYGKALATNSTGVWGEGANYDFYANGPGTNYGAPSSIRWKNNLIVIDHPIEKVKAIRGVYFDWDQEHGGKHDVGMIAEEVGKVMPEIVVYEENGTDASGMDYSKITPLLLEAIKAQQAEIDRLKERIASLENR